MRVYLAVVLLVMGALAGCSDKKDNDDDGSPDLGDDPSGSGSASAVLHLAITVGNQTFNFTSPGAAPAAGAGSSSASASTTSAAGNATAGNATAGNATGNATMPSGLAPLNATFALSATGIANGSSLAWTFDFGRAAGNASGNASVNATSTPPANGTSLPATLNHTYTAVGDYNVTFVLRVGNATAQSLRATLHVGNGTGNVTVTAALPAVTHFEFGESLGCTGDIEGILCIEWENGPPGSDIDGHWIPLDASYWGLAVTSTVVQSPAGPVGTPVGTFLNDSDCVFTDADQAILGEGNNGGGPCLGTVPDGSAWLFIYPYANPALEITVDFGVAPPA